MNLIKKEKKLAEWITQTISSQVVGSKKSHFFGQSDLTCPLQKVHRT